MFTPCSYNSILWGGPFTVKDLDQKCRPIPEPNSAAFRPSADLCKFVILQESQKTLVCEFGPKYVDFFDQTHVLTSKVYCKCNFFSLWRSFGLEKVAKRSKLVKICISVKGLQWKKSENFTPSADFCRFCTKICSWSENFPSQMQNLTMKKLLQYISWPKNNNSPEIFLGSMSKA